MFSPTSTLAAAAATFASLFHLLGLRLRLYRVAQGNNKQLIISIVSVAAATAAFIA